MWVSVALSWAPACPGILARFPKESLTQGCRHTRWVGRGVGGGGSQENSQRDTERAGGGAKPGCGPSFPLTPQETQVWSEPQHRYPWRPGGWFYGMPGAGLTRGFTSMGVIRYKTWGLGAISNMHSQQLGPGVPSTGVWTGLLF